MIVRPLETLKRGAGSWDATPEGLKFLKFLNYREIGNYIYERENREPILMAPLGSHMKEIISSLGEIDKAFSFKKQDFNKTVDQLQEEDPSLMPPKTPESFDDFVVSRRDFIKEKFITPVSELLGASSDDISEETVFLLVYSLLFDYLIKDSQKEPSFNSPFVRQGDYFITDYLIEVLQAGLVTEYKIKQV